MWKLRGRLKVEWIDYGPPRKSVAEGIFGLQQEYALTACLQFGRPHPGNIRTVRKHDSYLAGGLLAVFHAFHINGGLPPIRVVLG